jgi:predicted aldo/keto reductase-like oxidoreductase
VIRVSQRKMLVEYHIGKMLTRTDEIYEQRTREKQEVQVQICLGNLKKTEDMERIFRSENNIKMERKQTDRQDGSQIAVTQLGPMVK